MNILIGFQYHISRKGFVLLKRNLFCLPDKRGSFSAKE